MGAPIIVAVDPGLTSGVATFNTETKLFEGSELSFSNMMTLISALTPQDVVIYEQFVLRPGLNKKTRQMDAVWIVGALKYASIVQRFEIVEQSPAEAKSWADRERLKSFGIGSGEMKGSHRLDAFRHLTLYMAKKKLLPSVSGSGLNV